MGGFLKVVTYQEAQHLLKKNFKKTDIENVSLKNSFGRILAEDLVSPENIPAFTRSTMDGFAVACEDTFGSSETMPGIFELVGIVSMGIKPDFLIKAGQCAWVPTGGMLPPGSNAVVMVEYTEKMDSNTILIYKPVGLWENVMQTGEDIAQGELVFSRGKKLRPQDIGLLASLGIEQISVLNKYKIGVISTGDEIIPLQDKPIPGQVRDVNSYALRSAIESCGAIPCNYPIVADNISDLKKAMDYGLQDNDILLVSGGSSVGAADFTLDAMLSFPDSELLFHGIAIKPGKPTIAVRVGDQLIIGLPGHPVSALMIFFIICTPLLRSINEKQRQGYLTVNVSSQAGRDDFIPVRFIDNNYQLIKPLLGKSGLMNILAQADGYIHIDYEKQGISTSELVDVNLF